MWCAVTVIVPCTHKHTMWIWHLPKKGGGRIKHSSDVCVGVVCVCVCVVRRFNIARHRNDSKQQTESKKGWAKPFLLALNTKAAIKWTAFRAPCTGAPLRNASKHAQNTHRYTHKELFDHSFTRFVFGMRLGGVRSTFLLKPLIKKPNTANGYNILF